MPCACPNTLWSEAKGRGSHRGRGYRDLRVLSPEVAASLCRAMRLGAACTHAGLGVHRSGARACGSGGTGRRCETWACRSSTESDDVGSRLPQHQQQHLLCCHQQLLTHVQAVPWKAAVEARVGRAAVALVGGAPAEMAPARALQAARVSSQRKGEGGTSRIKRGGMN